MDKREAIDIAKKYSELVYEKYPILNVFLFGSFAKGTNHADSDIDLAIVFETVDDIIDLQIELMKMRTEDDLLIEPHPFCENEFNMSNPVAAEIIKNGIEINNFAA